MTFKNKTIVSLFALSIVAIGTLVAFRGNYLEGKLTYTAEFTTQPVSTDVSPFCVDGVCQSPTVTETVTETVVVPTTTQIVTTPTTQTTTPTTQTRTTPTPATPAQATATARTSATSTALVATATTTSIATTPVPTFTTQQTDYITQFKTYLNITLSKRNDIMAIYGTQMARTSQLISFVSTLQFKNDKVSEISSEIFNESRQLNTLTSKMRTIERSLDLTTLNQTDTQNSLRNLISLAKQANQSLLHINANNRELIDLSRNNYASFSSAKSTEYPLTPPADAADRNTILDKIAAQSHLLQSQFTDNQSTFQSLQVKLVSDMDSDIYATSLPTLLGGQDLLAKAFEQTALNNRIIIPRNKPLSTNDKYLIQTKINNLKELSQTVKLLNDTNQALCGLIRDGGQDG